MTLKELMNEYCIKEQCPTLAVEIERLVTGLQTAEDALIYFESQPKSVLGSDVHYAYQKRIKITAALKDSGFVK